MSFLQFTSCRCLKVSFVCRKKLRITILSHANRDIHAMSNISIVLWGTDPYYLADLASLSLVLEQ